jgi:hypothetical protein
MTSLALFERWETAMLHIGGKADTLPQPRHVVRGLSSLCANEQGVEPCDAGRGLDVLPFPPGDRIRPNQRLEPGYIALQTLSRSVERTNDETRGSSLSCHRTALPLNSKTRPGTSRSICVAHQIVWYMSLCRLSCGGQLHTDRYVDGKNHNRDKGREREAGDQEADR